MKLQGNDIHYNSDLNLVDMDINETISETHLGLEFLEKLEPKIKDIAVSFMQRKLSRKEMISNIVFCLEGISYTNFKKIGYEVGKSAKVKESMIPLLENLYPINLWTWSTSPKEVVEPFIKENVQKYYKGNAVVIATEVDVKNDTLTGRTIKIIDMEERKMLQYKRNSIMYSRL